jgi:hypothetical protein
MYIFIYSYIHSHLVLPRNMLRNLCVCVCVYATIYIYIYIYVCVCMYVYMYVCMNEKLSKNGSKDFVGGKLVTKYKVFIYSN